MSNQWQHGMFGCFDNFTVCIITYFVPCYTAGKTAETQGESCLLCGLAQMVPLLNIICNTKIRGKIRESKGIEGGLATDFLAHFCCYCCALTQEAQEVSSIGGQSIARE